MASRHDRTIEPSIIFRGSESLTGSLRRSTDLNEALGRIERELSRKAIV